MGIEENSQNDLQYTELEFLFSYLLLMCFRNSHKANYIDSAET
jgi:hypothetical protein